MIPPTEFSLLLLPLFIATSRTSVRLAGTGFVYTVEGRFFIVTAAHVADQFKGKIMALRGPQGYILPRPTDHGFLTTGGGMGDHADLAVAEVEPPDIAQLGNFVRFVDLSLVTRKFVITEGMYVGFLGYPKNVNKKIVARHGDTTAMMLCARQVAFKDPVYRKGFTPPVHICATFPRKRIYTLGPKPGDSSGPRMAPDPDGMSGGLVFCLDEAERQQGVIKVKGILGVVIEYHQERNLLVGMHISGVFEMLRVRWPELSPKLPILNLATGSCTIG